jgi:hypothetical protein
MTIISNDGWSVANKSNKPRNSSDCLKAPTTKINWWFFYNIRRKQNEKTNRVYGCGDDCNGWWRPRGKGMRIRNWSKNSSYVGKKLFLFK